MKYKILLPIFMILLFSCQKDNQKHVNCTDLKISLLNFDSKEMNIELNKLTIDMVPVSIENDELGHLNNLDNLIEMLNSGCDNINATKLCYACIKTYPAMSEIKIELDSLGNQIERIIDILTPEDDILSSFRMHEN